MTGHYEYFRFKIWKWSYLQISTLFQRSQVSGCTVCVCVELLIVTASFWGVVEPRRYFLPLTDMTMWLYDAVQRNDVSPIFLCHFCGFQVTIDHVALGGKSKLEFIVMSCSNDHIVVRAVSFVSCLQSKKCHHKWRANFRDFDRNR
jgi:hypothetical protein